MPWVPAAAIGHYREGLAVAGQILRNNPAHATIRQDLAASQRHMARCQIALGDCDGTRATYAAAAENWKALPDRGTLTPEDSR